MRKKILSAAVAFIIIFTLSAVASFSVLAVGENNQAPDAAVVPGNGNTPGDNTPGNGILPNDNNDIPNNGNTPGTTAPGTTIPGTTTKGNNNTPGNGILPNGNNGVTNNGNGNTTNRNTTDNDITNIPDDDIIGGESREPAGTTTPGNNTDRDREFNTSGLIIAIIIAIAVIVIVILIIPKNKDGNVRK